MNQAMKTLGFIAVAAVSVMVAAGTYYANRPVDLNDFSDVGEKFFPKFEDPNEATGLQVAAYQEETGKTELFKVDVKDGLWVIPSHHDYPADAQDQLAKTAASMVGVVRLALIERTKAAQKRYDVVDPLDKEAGTEGRGDRITLYKGNETLVDFIVGKKVENSDNLYYVRKADEDRIYTADLGRLSVSTKFSDWIKKDVLEITRSDVNEILIERYHVDEARGKVVPDGLVELTRETGATEWKLGDLKESGEQLKSNDVNTLLNTLDELQIVGVRPKPAGLSAGLKGEAESISVTTRTQMDMQEKGVFIDPRGGFIYNEGKVNVGLNSGVVYELGFGEEFSGSEIDIEIGKQTPAAEVAEKIAENVESKPVAEEEGKKNEDQPDAAEKSDDADKKIDGQKTSRYLFVMAFFDKSLLGPEPVAPVKPEPPAEKTDDTAAETPASAQAPAADAEKKAADPKAEYEKALEEYKLQQEVFELKKKEYAGQIESGEKRVAELNRRFADWYYVISEETFTKLKLKRDDLVEEVKVEEMPEKEASTPEGSSEQPAAEKPAVMEKAPADKPAEPAADKKDTDEKEPEKKEPEKPAEDGKPAEEKSEPAPDSAAPAEEKPAAEKPAGETPAESAPDPAETPAAQE